ncbi:aldose epimerase family protein [Alloiococcus sp. CFN-8]|uniref:aldose epimerase family protein n=1 Tax=Alloiococcus sp. CFN-8 TaxID=3416081 RepID=UPI003CF27B43
MKENKRLFGKISTGEEVYIYTLSNSKGMEVDILDFGGIVVSIRVPDKVGKIRDVVLGYDSMEEYEDNPGFFGAIVGRHANRIAGASFILGDTTYYLDKNEGNNQLHGGKYGLHKVRWEANLVNEEGEEALLLNYYSEEKANSFPGNISLKVKYILTEDNKLRIEYMGESDKDTILNLTNHSYFNLSGHDSGDVLSHELYINSKSFTPVNAELIPYGRIEGVKGTPMDFTTLKPIGKDIKSDYGQVAAVSGYDHNWVLDTKGRLDEIAADLRDENSGIGMRVYTTKPGIQIYTTNTMKEPTFGKGRVNYHSYQGICLETQYYPNAINEESFPSPILKAGDKYLHTTIFEFYSL